MVIKYMENRKETTERDEQLKKLFDGMSEEHLSDGFRIRMMQKIEKVAIRKHRKQLIWSWVALISASSLIIGVAVFNFLYYQMPLFHKSDFAIGLIPKSTLSIYTLVMGIAFILLYIDYKFRAWYRKRHTM